MKETDFGIAIDGMGDNLMKRQVMTDLGTKIRVLYICHIPKNFPRHY